MIYAVPNCFQILPQDGNYGIADLEISLPPQSCFNDMKKMQYNRIREWEWCITSAVTDRMDLFIALY